MTLPPLAPIRQTAPQPTVADVAAEVRRQWRSSKTAKRIKPGMRIAVAVLCGGGFAALVAWLLVRAAG